MQFGKAMKLMRCLRKMSQPELSVKASIGMSYISLVEAGKLNPKHEALERIRVALDWPQSADCLLDKLEAVTMGEK